MYRMIIADDERMICKGLSVGFAWNDMGFEIAGTAADGKEALELIESESPEVVLTDIRMPEMDGLELIAKVKRSGRNVKFVIISGFCDFDYAKKAIELGVHNYILKPVMKEDVVETMQNLKLILDSEKDYSRTCKEMDEQKKLILDQALSNSIHGPLDAVIANMLLEQLRFRDGAFGCLLIKLDKAVIWDKKQTEEDKQLMRFFIRNIAEESVEIMGAKGYALEIGDTRTLLFVNVPSYSEDVIKDLVSFIFQNLNLYMGKVFINETISMICGKMVEDFRQIWLSFESVRKNEKALLYKGFQSIVLIGTNTTEAEEKEASILQKYANYRGHLIEQVILAKKEQVYTCISEMFTEIEKEARLGLDEIKNLLAELLADIVKAFEAKGIFFSPNEVNIKEWMDNFEILVEFKEGFTKCMDKFIQLVEDKKINNYQYVIIRVKDFIEKNYMREISLENVAENVHLTAPYVSFLFKQEMGETFIDYLNEFRIKKSQELLAKSDIKIYEVAEKVGYNSYRHYCKVFSRYVGLSPKDFRNKNRAIFEQT